MNAFDLVPAEANVTMSVTAPVEHHCPFKNELDEGRITIAWDCAGATVELHSLADYLAAFTFREISHEDLVGEIFEKFASVAPQIVVRSVTARFTTAGIDVEVSRSAVPVDAVRA